MEKFYNTQRHYVCPRGERNTLPSQTVLGESYTIEELFARVHQGTMTGANTSHAEYFDVALEEIDDFFRKEVDLTDLDRLRSRAEELTGLIAKARDAKEKKKGSSSMGNESEDDDDEVVDPAGQEPGKDA